MKTIWDPDAKASLRQIANYVKSKFGSKARQKYMQKVKETESLLKQSPNIGPIDPLFNGRPKTYRSVIINGLSKMVYYIDDDTIYIAAFWDTRREPKTQAQQVNDKFLKS